MKTDPKWDPLIFCIVFSVVCLLVAYLAYNDVQKYRGDKSMREKLERILIQEECGSWRVDELLIVRKDYGAKLVVGIGHDIRPSDELKLGDKISYAQSSRLFTVDVNAALDSASSIISGFSTHPEDVQIVVSAMCFQLGRTGVRKFKKMIAAINDRNYDLAADEMLNSLWAKQTTRRAQRMASLMRISVPSSGG